MLADGSTDLSSIADKKNWSLGLVSLSRRRCKNPRPPTPTWLHAPGAVDADDELN